MTDIRNETFTRWLVRDAADGLYLRLGGVRREAHGRRIAFFEPETKATAFSSPEAAANASLAVDPDRFATLEFVEERVLRKSAGKAAATVPAPKTSGVIDSSWLKATGSMSARDLLDTLRVVESRSVDPRDLPSVAAIFDEVIGRTGTAPAFR